MWKKILNLLKKKNTPTVLLQISSYSIKITLLTCVFSWLNMKFESWVFWTWFFLTNYLRWKRYFFSQFENNSFFISNILLEKTRPKYSTFNFHITSPKNVCECGYFDVLWGHLRQNCGRGFFFNKFNIFFTILKKYFKCSRKNISSWVCELILTFIKAHLQVNHADIKK